MDLMEAIKKRRSVRRFKPDKIPDDLIRKIIEAGVLAPSACNMQGWRFIVVDDQKIKEKIVDNGGAITIKSAPVGILVVYDKRTGNTEYQDYIQSAAAAIQNLLLAATHYGLGSCWVCQLPLKGRLRKILDIPKDFSPIGYILLGYPEREAREVARIHSLDDLIGRNLFNHSLPRQKPVRPSSFFYRFSRKAYYILPVFVKKIFLNKFIDKKFVKKFDD